MIKKPLKGNFSARSLSVPSIPDLDSASDSGTLSTDNITKVTTPVFTGTADVGCTVTLYDTNGTTVLGSSTADSGGMWSITSSTLSEGMHSLTTKADDGVGNVSTASSALTVTVDTLAPAIGTPDLMAASDSGVSSSDNLTNKTTPNFTGTAEANSTVTLYDTDGTTSLGTTTANGMGKWTIPSSKLTEGAHMVSAKATDAAGNVSSASSKLTATIDTTAPVTAPDALTLDSGTDSGVSNSDGITNVSGPCFNGTGADANSWVNVYADGALLGTTLSDGSGNYNYSATFLVDGVHVITGKNVDNAGNIGPASSGLSVTIDMATPTTTVATIVFSNDAGPSSTDFITKTAAQTISGTTSFNLVSSEIVEVSLDNGGTWAQATTAVGSNAWSLAGQTLTGSDTLQVRVSDLAGNANSAVSQAYVLDTIAPTNTVSTVSFSADTGVSSTDFVTNTAAQTLSGILKANMGDGDLVEVSLNNGSTWTTATTTDGLDSWSSSQTLTASDTLKVRVTDLAGNTTTALSQAYVLDTVAPAVSAPDLAAASDSGIFSFDNYTNNTTPTFNGTAEVSATVTLYDSDGTTVLATATADGAGKWSMVSSTLLEGTHTLTTKATDAAGNVGNGSSSLSVTIDTTAPATAPNAPTLNSANDSGVSNSDNITNTAGPVLNGTGATNNQWVNLYDGASLIDIVQADSSGNYSYTLSNLTDAVHTITAKSVDLAGNVGSASAPLSLTIDTATPTTTVATIAFSSDTGSSSTDFITKTAAQTLSGTTTANLVSDEIVQVSLDNGGTWTLATTSVNSNTWSLSGQTLTSSNTLQVRVSDVAGNAKTAVSQAYVLDTTAPTTAASTVSFSADTGVSSSDFTTKTAAQTLSGTLNTGLGAGELVEVSLNNGSTWTTATTTLGDPAWSLSGQTLTASDTLKVRVSDVAGNTTSPLSQAYVLDTTAPALASAITISDTALKIGDTATVTFTFTEAVSGFTTADVNVPSGKLSGLSSSNGGITWTATLTPTASVTAASNVLTLDNTGYTDKAGNAGMGSSTSDNYAVDTVAPTFNSAGSTPADNAASVSRTIDLIVAFSEPLDASSDLTKVYLKTAIGGTLVPATVTLNGSGQLVVHPTATLNAATDYAVNWDAGALKDAAGNTAAAVSDLTTYNFTTEAAPPSEPVLPTDTDGVSETVENAVPALPNSSGGTPVVGDGNGDGVPDGQQNNVTSAAFLVSPTAQSAPGNATKVYVTLVADSLNGKVDTQASTSAQLKNVVQTDAPKDLPANLSTPLGQIAFSAAVQTGATEKFSLYVDGSIDINGYFKKDASGQWVNLASPAFGGKVVTEGGKTRLDFSITDGGAFDVDGKADGVITDPGAPGKLVFVACPYDPFRLDTDRDGIPDAVESPAGMNPAVKDNNVFGNTSLFVNQLYRDLLSREGAGDAGAQYWAAKIDSGAVSKTQVFDALLNSPEFDTHAATIMRLYHAVLGRSPELCGYNYWMGQVNAGATGQQLGNAFASSAEFLGSNPSLTDAAFVDLIYQSVLKRAPDTAGKAYWVSQLQTGAQDRGTMLFNVAQSTEFKAAMASAVAVDTLYLGLLDRSVSQAEFTAWAGQYTNYSSTTQFLQAATAASTEYHDRFLPSDNTTHSVADVTLVGIVT